MLDPNPKIRGLGDQALSDANIEVQMFPRDLRAAVEELDREFIMAQRARHERGPGAAISDIEPNLKISGFAYPSVALRPDGVWRHENIADATNSKALVFNVRNDAYKDGFGFEAKSVRAQLFFEYDDRIPGPSFSPLAWLWEPHGIIDIPVGTEKQLLVGVKLVSGGWMGYTNSRLFSTDVYDSGRMRGDYLPDRTVTMILLLIADVQGSSKVIFKAYFDWKVDYGTNHPIFSQKPEPPEIRS